MPISRFPVVICHHPIFRQLQLLLALCLALFCNPSIADLQQATINPIIEVRALKALLAKSAQAPVLVDVRPYARYAQAHLVGAINLPVAHSFNDDGDRTRIASLQQIRELLSKLGINNSDYLVLYDDGMLKDAAHVFWVLETYGHKKLSVLDGGIAAWTVQHGNVTSIETLRQKSQYIPSITTHRLSTQLATLLGIKNPNVEIIDARSHQEYLGLNSKAKRKGHIPGAINIPWNANLIQDKAFPSLRSNDLLHKLYRSLDKKKNVIAYCNRGKESAVTYLVLRNLGYKVSIYDGAWLEWGNDDHLPIVSGKRLYGANKHAP